MFEYKDPQRTFLDRLERRLPWLAIPNLALYILGGQAFLTAFALGAPDMHLHLGLDASRVAQGEWWRLFTFVMVPSTSPMSLVFAIFWFSFFWFLCQSLEAQWGAWRTSFYITLGWLCQVVVALAAWAFWRLPLDQTGYYLFLSLQLAFAWYFPNHVIYIYFILPVRMSVMAWIITALLIYQAVTGWPHQALIILSSLFNYVLFFASDHARNLKTLHESSLARSRFSKAISQAKAEARPKRCVECGADPNAAELRLCTCEACGEDGKFWCLEHLKPHLSRPNNSQ